LVEQMRDEQVAFVFNTPNQFSRPGYLKMGWTDLGRISIWVRTRASIRLAKGVLQRGWSRSGIEQDPFRDSRFQSVSDLLKLPDMVKFEDLQSSDDPSFRTPVDLKYLNWRYAKIPGFEYSAAWKCGNDGDAAIIFRESRRGDLSELRLCQVLLNSSPRSPRLARQLICEVTQETRPDYAVGISTNANESKALLGAGFLPIPRAGPIFTVRQLNEAPGTVDLFRRSNWSLCIGDLELF
jgi:hypothetical protein